ncbi:cell wall hydrolase [Lachnoclostridium phytofermentans]|uniref:cell wall hydrolase n=1 Tax=Lachnoclostridium phytofermentans TaxID=66219 RepID=UPI000495554B|nr:cell wall hydrolase [Lachnoclostridium phytofermentans]
MKAKTKVSVILVMLVCFFATMVITDTTCYSIGGTYEEDSQIAATNTSEDEANQLDIAKSKQDEFANTEKIDLFSLEAQEDNSSDNLRSSNDDNVSVASLTNENDADANDSMKEDLEQKAVQENVIARAVASSVEGSVAASINPEEEIVTFSMAEALQEYEKVLPKVNEYLNIRSEANPDAAVVGQLNKNSYATIVERGEEWTKITSGKVTGYASNQYLYFDEEARNLVSELKADQVVITAGSVNIRKSPDLTGEILTEAKSKDSFIHISEKDNDEWYAIQYDDSQIGYVSKDLSDSVFNLKTAITIEEIEEAKKAVQIAKDLEEAKKHKPTKTNRAAIEVSDEEIYLLATVVAMEAMSESYEGQLAVANVVVNRMLDGYWGDTIHDVVYAPGQFSGANSGRIEKFRPKVTESCKKAAIEALAGNNNIGDYMYFRMKNTAKTSSYKKYYILGNHCFYSR